MTDSRAALEERAREERCKFERVREIVTWCYSDISEFAADFAEQESSSLKLLLSAMVRGDAQVFAHARIPNIAVGRNRYALKLDSSGIPCTYKRDFKSFEKRAVSGKGGSN